MLRNNADPGVRDKQGYSAVHYASAYGRTLCLELVRTRTTLRENMLHVSHRVNKLELCKLNWMTSICEKGLEL